MTDVDAWTGSYGELSPLVWHERHRRETGRRPREAQRFLSVHTHIGNLLRMRHRYPSASGYRYARRQAFAAWQEVTGLHNVA